MERTRPAMEIGSAISVGMLHRVVDIPYFLKVVRC